jgi:glyoxylase-like metal-dependent hydrolase (beta-lactamase superfamily II)
MPLTWVEDGALSLGVASYAIVDGEEALVYDSHTTLDLARAVRRELEAAGVTRITVLLSHRHLDHVAGTEAFADCEVLAGGLTNEWLTTHREAIESGTHIGPPAIKPLILPTRVLTGPTTLHVGTVTVEAFPADIHSRDHYLLWLPEQRILLAGDTVEDTLTYVGEPDRLEDHLADFHKLTDLAPERILPAHGAPDIIASGGYDTGIIRATEYYIAWLLRAKTDPSLRSMELRDVLADALDRGWCTYYEPYEEVHRSNLKLLLGDS